MMPALASSLVCVRNVVAVDVISGFRKTKKLHVLARTLGAVKPLKWI